MISCFRDFVISLNKVSLPKFKSKIILIFLVFSIECQLKGKKKSCFYPKIKNVYSYYGLQFKQGY